MQQMNHSPLSRAIYGRQETMSTKWVTGPKDGIGTAFYSPEAGPSPSNVWYTLSSGILTEVFYPDVATPNLLSFEFIVTDNESVVDFERQDMVHETRLLFEDSLVYEQVNTARTGHYQLKKTFVTDPRTHALLLHVEFRLLSKEAKEYRLGMVMRPAVSGTPMDDIVASFHHEAASFLAAYDDTQALVVACANHVSFSNIQCSEGPGQVWIGAQLGHGQPVSDLLECTICIGFGHSVEVALQTAQRALARPFASVVTDYRKGWEDYLKIFNPPECADRRLYLASLMTMKAHEDKLNPGAVVASLATPWEPDFNFEGRLGGYHVVWPRDLCQTATSFAAAGDSITAHRILTYLDEVLQLENGSFPQNAWPDGTPNWQGCQMDQTAMPILLAWALGATERYESLVRPAAEFLVANGPFSEQERWEENAGYSPSTLAAEIASLVVAAEMAKQRGDFLTAGKYYKTADAWEAELENWLVTRNGKLSRAPYYLRITPSQNPDDGSMVLIKNGQGWRDKTKVVDAGFLELVRLGIRPADDPILVHSLSVVDESIGYEASYGPVWRRYSYDGYGEHENGDNYDGMGLGRPWPLLSGERGEYEVAWLASNQTVTPRRFFGPVRLLQSLAKAANEGWMLPEQIWDGQSLEEKGLGTDRGNHSATPLVWAHAEYVRLAECIRCQRIVEMPQVVYDRYVKSRGRDYTRVIADCWNDVTLPLVVYPTNQVFQKGDFDLERVTVEESCGYVYFHIHLGHLDNPWLGPNGFSKQIIDIYLGSNSSSSSGSSRSESELNDVGVSFVNGYGYETKIRVTGDWHSDTGIYSSDGFVDKNVYVFVTPVKRVVHVVVKASSIHGVPGPGWSMAVTIAGESGGRIRPVEETVSEWTFGRRFTTCRALLTDFLVPNGDNKKKYVLCTNGSVLMLPMVSFNSGQSE